MKNLIRGCLVLLTVVALALTGAGCTAKAKKAYHLSKANRFYDAGQYEKAEIEYVNVLRNDPSNAQAFSRLGLIYSDQGRLQRAMYFLAKGSQMAPDNLELRLKLGFLYTSIGQFTQGVAQANYILDKNPKDDQAPILLAEGSVMPKAAAAARDRLQSMARNADSAPIEVALGNLSMIERDFAAASSYYKKAQALDPKSPDVNGAQGMLAWVQGDLKQAEAGFKAAAEASPPRSLHQMQYVRFKLQTGDHDGARALLSDLTKAAPDYLPASMMLAEISAAEKKYDESAEWLDKVLQLDENNYDALYFQGQLDIARGDLNKAVSDMERMEHLYSQVPQVHYQLGSAYLEVGNLPKAADSFNRALELNPNYLEASLLLAQIQIRTGNAAPAIVALEAVRQKQPHLLQAQLLLADAYRLQNRVSDSLAVYDSLGTTYPTNEQVAQLYGAALLQNGDNAGARTQFERALKIAPHYLPLIGEMVDLDISEKKFDEAMQLVNSEIQSNPKKAEFPILQAKIAVAQGKSGQAESFLNQALTVDPENISAYLLLAQLYADTGQNDKALAKVDAVMAKDTKNISALMLTARIYESNKDYKKAAEAYEKVLVLDPKFSSAMNNVAYLYSEYLDNLDRAFELAQDARQLMPYDPSIADTLGWISFKKGSYANAVSLLKESVSKLSAMPEVQFHYGMACYMTADEATARTALQLAWQAGQNFPGRDECGNCIAILNINPATADAAAQATLEKRVAGTPGDPVAQGRLAGIYLRQGSNDKAVAAYEAVLQAAPNNLDAMTHLIQLYSPKDPRKAYEMAKAAYKLAPYDPELSHTLGRLAFLCGDYQEAASTLQQTLQNQPNNALLLFDYAQAAYSIGKVSTAQSTLQNALAASLPAPEAAHAQRILDMIALAADPAQAAAATTRIEGVLKSEADDAPALMARAAAAEFQSDPATAEPTYEKVLAHYPDFTPAEIRLARLDAMEPAKLNRAYELASKAHDEQPDDPQITKILGIIMFQHGDYGHAANLLMESALKLNSDGELYYYLGNAQYHLKHMAESKASLQQALALKLSAPQTDSAKQMLSTMK